MHNRSKQTQKFIFHFVFLLVVIKSAIKVNPLQAASAQTMCGEKETKCKFPRFRNSDSLEPSTFSHPEGIGM
jgi:hypothetical protein